MICFAIALFAATVASSREISPADQDTALLHAIAEVESGNNPVAIGRRGELSAYQLDYWTWRLHTSFDFSLAHTRPDLAERVARSHLAWLHHALLSADLPDTPENLACAWNAGPGAVIHGRISAATRDYARRVVNLLGKNQQ
jgi:hypothetical protein